MEAGVEVANDRVVPVALPRCSKRVYALRRRGLQHAEHRDVSVQVRKPVVLSRVHVWPRHVGGVDRLRGGRLRASQHLFISLREDQLAMELKDGLGGSPAHVLEDRVVQSGVGEGVSERVLS